VHKSIASAALLLSSAAASTSAAPPDVVYQFEVRTETLRSFPCEINPSQPNCTVRPNPAAPYPLGRLTITHKAFSNREAQWSNASSPVANSGIVSWAFEGFDQFGTGPMIAMFNQRLSEPSTDPADRHRFTFDVDIHGGELSGMIDVTEAVLGGCGLTMQGTDGNWSGSWFCGESDLHAITAVVKRVTGHIAQN